MIKYALPIITIVLLAACSAKGDYPSLSPRPIEAAAKSMLAVPAPVPEKVEATNAATVQRINEIVGLAKAGHAAFQSALAEAQDIVRQNPRAMNGSEGWVANQVAVSRVEVARAATKDAQAGLDSIRNKLIAGAPSADQQLLERAVAEVSALATRQREAFDALEATATSP